MKPALCVLSVADHTGWAHVLCIAAEGHVPVVVQRRRVTLIDAGLPTQPHEHESIGMQEADADALIARVRRSIASRTALVLERLVGELAPTHTVVALAIREPPFAKLPPTVAEAWESRRLLYAADGMMYQLAVCQAARWLGLDVQMCRRGEETDRAAKRLGVTPEEIEEFVFRTGRPDGPPWTQEHRRAYAAGIAVLQQHVSAPLTLSSPA